MVLCCSLLGSPVPACFTCLGANQLHRDVRAVRTFSAHQPL